MHPKQGSEYFFFCLLALWTSALRNLVALLKTYLPETVRKSFIFLKFCVFMKALYQM